MVAGWLLARAGVDVVVLEKHADFLRDFRGDTIHPSTLEMMYELGVLDAFLALPHTEQTGLQIDLLGERVAGPDFSHVPTHCKFIAFMPQWDFLRFAEQQARAYPGFQLRMKTAATGLVVEGDRVVGVRTATDEIRATLVLACDGRHSILREGLPLRELSVPIDVLWMRIPRRASDGDALFGILRRDQFLVMIDRADYWQCAYLIKKGGLDELKARGIAAFHARLAELVPELADRVGALTWDDLKLLSVTVDRLERWYRPGLLCIGDAAHAMSPVGGVGINLAIQDAIAAANALYKPLRAGKVPERVLAGVQSRRMLMTRLVQGMQTQLHERMLAPVLAGHGDAAVRTMRRLFKAPVVPRIMARVVGVGIRRERVTAPAATHPAAPSAR
jgi:2-polyprenyl-6-methoxyphenol hydroxylase-like FAD-dependent oxidoreductase